MIEFDVRTTTDGIGVVVPKGRLNMVAARQLRETLTGFVDGGTNRIVVDLAETTFLDSSALGALVAGPRALAQLADIECYPYEACEATEENHEQQKAAERALNRK